MADSYIGLPTDGGGKKVDAEQLIVGANTVQRERDQIAGLAADDVAVVTDTDVLPSEHGLAVRPINLVSPQYSTLSSSALSAGSEVNLDASTIPAATTGKLIGVTLASSVPCRWEIKSRDGAVLLTFAVLFSTYLVLSLDWRPPDKRFTILLGNGVDENFRVTVKNMSGDQTADVYATIFWDEV